MKPSLFALVVFWEKHFALSRNIHVVVVPTVGKKIRTLSGRRSVRRNGGGGSLSARKNVYCNFFSKKLFMHINQ